MTYFPHFSDKFFFVFLSLFLNFGCENNQKQSAEQESSSLKYEYKPGYLDSNYYENQKRFYDSKLQEISEYIRIVDIVSYTDENMKRKAKFKIKNISNKTITTLLIDNGYDPRYSEIIKTNIEPGQTKTVLSQREVHFVRGRDGTIIESSKTVTVIRFTDGTVVGYYYR